MQEAFKLSVSKDSNTSSCRAEWDSINGEYLAITYTTRSSTTEDQTRTSSFITIYNRSAKQILKKKVEDGNMVDMCWSKDVEKAGQYPIMLAVTLDNGTIILWEPNSSVSSFDAGMSNLIFGKWSYAGNILAVGNEDGYVVLWNRDTADKTTLQRKHSAKLTSFTWSDISDLNYLCIASEDGCFSVNRSNGETVFTGKVSGIATDIKLRRTKTGDEKLRDLFTAVINSRILYVQYIYGSAAPIEIPMKKQYGSIISYEWLDDDTVLIGFSKGCLVVVSAFEQPGQEISLVKAFNDSLDDMILSPSKTQIALLGSNTLQIRALSDFQNSERSVTIEGERLAMESLSWSPDGQYISVSSATGHVYTYSRKATLLHASDTNGNFCFVSGGQEIFSCSVKDVENLITFSDAAVALSIPNESLCKIILSFQPEKLFVNYGKIAIAAKSELMIFQSQKGILAENDAMLQVKLPGEIKSLVLSATKAVCLTDEALIVVDMSSGEQALLNEAINPVLSTADHVIGTFKADNSLLYLNCQSLRSWTAFQFPESSIISSSTVFGSNVSGLHLIFGDTQQNMHYLDIHSGTLIKIKIPEKYQDKVQQILWREESYENDFKSVVYVFSAKWVITLAIYTFVIKGEPYSILAVEPAPEKLKPLAITGEGKMFFHGDNGTILGTQLKSHAIRQDLNENDIVRLYCLGYIRKVWKLLKKDTSVLKRLTRLSLNILDLESYSSFMMLDGFQAEAVMISTYLNELDDKNLLIGLCASIMGEFDIAEAHYLKSSTPKQAVYMRRDMHEWEAARLLAEKIAPEELYDIMTSYALQLEHNQKWKESFNYYKTSLNYARPDSNLNIAYAGLSRVTFRLGDVPQGLNSIKKLQGKQERVYVDCGSILESIRQFQEAAFLYEKGNSIDKAVEMYLKVKNYSKVVTLLDSVKDLKIILAYGNAMESEKNYNQALEAYKKARDYKSQTRLLLLNNEVEKAIQLSESSSDDQARMLVINYFLQSKDYASLIGFCLSCGMNEEAFQYARQHGNMETYAQLMLKKNGGVFLDSEKAHVVEQAKYFELNHNYCVAGELYAKLSGQESKALDLLLKETKDVQRALRCAIEIVGKAREDKMTAKLTDHLINYIKRGDSKISSEGGRLLISLYLKLENFEKASEYCLVLAKEEQANGNYKTSRDLLRDTYRHFSAEPSSRSENLESSMKIMYQRLAVVHSYMLIKPLVKADDHKTAALMLRRIVKNLEDFPQHKLQILSSAFIESVRSNLTKDSYDYAVLLCQPSFRSQLDPKFRKKVELVVRKPPTENTDQEVPKSPCHYCMTMIEESHLTCDNCAKEMEFCIASGLHMFKEEWCVCSCGYPMLKSRAEKLISAGITNCTMCDVQWNAGSLKIRTE